VELERYKNCFFYKQALEQTPAREFKYINDNEKSVIIVISRVIVSLKVCPKLITGVIDKGCNGSVIKEWGWQSFDLQFESCNNAPERLWWRPRGVAWDAKQW
jgi:hypothetical protein